MKITPAQVHWFRLRRSGLVKPFATPEETAGRLIGVQAQLPPAADLAFGWNLLGAVVGGLAEFFSMALGFRAMTLVAVTAYLLAFLVARRSPDAVPHSPQEGPSTYGERPAELAATA